MGDKRKLRALSGKLAALVDVLSRDPRTTWKRKFEIDLAQCDALLAVGPSREDVVALAQSVMPPYAGMGSFNDYALSIYDPETGRYAPAPGTEGFESLAKEVFDAALALRAG